MAKHIDGTDGQGWYTKFHDRNDFIRRSLPRRHVPYAIAVYDVLVALANRHGDSRFRDRIDAVCFAASVSYNTARKVIGMLDGLLIEFIPPMRGEDGRYGLCEFTILKSSKKTPKDLASESQKPLSSSDSTSRSSSDSSMSTNLNLIRKEQEERITTTASVDAPDRKKVIEQAFVERGVINCNSDIDRAIDEFLATATDEIILAALRAAGEARCPGDKITRWVRSYITNEKHPPPRRPSSRTSSPSRSPVDIPPDVWD